MVILLRICQNKYAWILISFRIVMTKRSHLKSMSLLKKYNRKAKYETLPLPLLLQNLWPIAKIFEMHVTLQGHNVIKTTAFCERSRYKRKKEEICLSPMTKAPIATLLSKGKSENTNNATKKFNYNLAFYLYILYWFNILNVKFMSKDDEDHDTKSYNKDEHITSDHVMWKPH